MNILPFASVCTVLLWTALDLQIFVQFPDTTEASLVLPLHSIRNAGLQYQTSDINVLLACVICGSVVPAGEVPAPATAHEDDVVTS